MGIAIGAIGALTVINVLGTKLGGRVQVVGTALKMSSFALMFALPFLMGKADFGRLSPFWPERGASAFIPGVMAAMVPVLWAYDGWVNLTPLAEILRDPGRNIPRALILGVAALIAVYLGLTLAYHLVLTMGEVQAPALSHDPTHIVAADYWRHLVGPPGVRAICLIVMASTFISLNGYAMSGPWSYFAMARDRLFFQGLARVNSRFMTPANAILRSPHGRPC